MLTLATVSLVEGEALPAFWSHVRNYAAPELKTNFKCRATASLLDKFVAHSDIINSVAFSPVAAIDGGLGTSPSKLRLTKSRINSSPSKKIKGKREESTRFLLSGSFGQLMSFQLA